MQIGIHFASKTLSMISFSSKIPRNENFLLINILKIIRQLEIFPSCHPALWQISKKMELYSKWQKKIFCLAHPCLPNMQNLSNNMKFFTYLIFLFIFGNFLYMWGIVQCTYIFFNIHTHIFFDKQRHYFVLKIKSYFPFLAFFQE